MSTWKMTRGTDGHLRARIMNLAASVVHWTQNSLPSGSSRTTQYSNGSPSHRGGSSQTFCLTAPSPKRRSTSLPTYDLRVFCDTAGLPLTLRYKGRRFFLDLRVST